MADQENIENAEQNAAEEASSEKKSGGKLLSLLVPIITALVLAGGGFFVGRMFGTRGNTQNVAAAEEEPAELTAEEQAANASTEVAWSYDMEAVVTYLDEPGVTRYIRLGVTLGIGEGLPEKDGIPLLEKKMPMLKDWLTLYMTNKSIADIQGEARLRVMKDEIATAFNKGLFADGSKHIKAVYINTISIQ